MNTKKGDLFDNAELVRLMIQNEIELFKGKNEGKYPTRGEFRKRLIKHINNKFKNENEILNKLELETWGFSD